MENSRLDFLKRKSYGKKIMAEYEKVFIDAGLQSINLIHVELEKSDSLISSVQDIFPVVEEQTEILPYDILPSDSKLLKQVIEHSNCCYLYLDEVYYCGMYLVETKLAYDSCLTIAKLSNNNTCFLLDRELKFSMRINFYNIDYNEDNYRNKFDLQLKIVPPLPL